MKGEDPVLGRLLCRRVVPVVALDREEDAEPLAAALLAGGLDVMEITFRTPAAEGSIRRLARNVPEMLTGAGTLLEPGQVRRARDAGALFGVAPGFNPAVAAAAAECGLLFAPGVMSPSEVEQALAAGCRLQKFFPAEAAGGTAMLKALAGPYGHVGLRFIPTGGVGIGNMASYLALPVVAAVGGSWMVERKLIAAGNWAEITRLTAGALACAAAAGG